ncbi:signal peptidase I [Pirellulimonas nuda]|uniref:signal peptidase I n=1 Tax=Pirellulimonas nuda TaxID=2528009 RepID=UPI001E4ABF74|nr:signal peptidase I [Pirellulimonas nuda]
MGNDPRAESAAPAATGAKKPKGQATRETVESLVVAFVLAFLFRTFQGEPFVIPTGSMAPTLMGQHYDLNCPQCGQRHRAGCSDEHHERLAGMTQSDRARHQVVAAMCPSCRYVQPVRPDDIPGSVPETSTGMRWEEPRPGDRIVVNKFAYSFADPQRFDVIVFKFPGDTRTNYIKRLVGLPGETIRILQGDLYVTPKDGTESIARKSGSKLAVMRRLVHDTEHDAPALYEAGWPLRWTSDAEDWKADVKVSGNRMTQRYNVENPTEDTSWLRYRHTIPGYAAWRTVRESLAQGQPRRFEPGELTTLVKPHLVTDFIAYNAVEQRGPQPIGVRTSIQEPSLQGVQDLDVPETRQGLHWVGDLILDATLDIKSDSGAVVLELVESGQHFRCEIDVATGKATLNVEAFESGAPSPDVTFSGDTSVRGPGVYALRFANVDDQLRLWVDGDPSPLSGDGAYDPVVVFGSAGPLAPRTSPVDEGDLSPAAIGLRGASASVTSIALHRDLYYISTNASTQGSEGVTDFPDGLIAGLRSRGQLAALATDPELWSIYNQLPSVEFSMQQFEDPQNDQLFVLGDNSAESADSRLWYGGGSEGGRPGGPYVERRLLIGKAVAVYWPRALVKIPGTPIPLIPNFGDMRFIR